VSYYWRPADIVEELPKVTRPTLIVRGGKSQVLSEGAAERMRAKFPQAEAITVEQAGHTVPEDTPDEFIAAVRSFLERY
jgi:non-heme chloroperoxidase